MFSGLRVTLFEVVWLVLTWVLKQRIFQQYILSLLLPQLNSPYFHKDKDLTIKSAILFP